MKNQVERHKYHRQADFERERSSHICKDRHNHIGIRKSEAEIEIEKDY